MFQYPRHPDGFPVKPDPLRLGRHTSQTRQARRSIADENAVRLLPVHAFTWGSRAVPQQPRTRPDHVLIWVTNGRVRLDFPRASLWLIAGDLRHIPAGTAFSALADNGAQGLAVLIPARLAYGATPPLPERGLATHVGNNAPQMEATLHQLAVEGPNPDPAMTACLVNLLSLRLRQLAPARSDDAPQAMASDQPLLDRFLALARQGLGEYRSVAELAAELGCTTLTLDQACRQAHSKRAVDLIHDLQLDCAKDLLRNTERPIHNIACRLGYSSHAHFNRAFAAATGRSPQAFRAQPG
ncbi:helix-turn-helix transcriptional regulator [Paracoccus sediminis]|nr:AraC family transcriptional regulator [Paracoccus sediminis]SNR56635.1 transcriptional regulator, AraC family [Paracoccus sediminis]